MTITRAVDDGIATITLDDGKVNALDTDVLAALDTALDECADDRAVVLCGRDGVFSAGLDRTLLDAPRQQLVALSTALTRTAMRLWLAPRPVVAAATGHAVAAGVILAMVCDHAVAAEGDYRWGLNETAIGLPLPEWVIDLARTNVRADRLDGLALSGRLVGPADAVDVGFADELAPPDAVVTRARQRAAALADLPVAVYATTKRRLRGRVADAALAAADRDPAAMLMVAPDA
jgi:enoyl-CoA hydratase